MKRDDMPMYDDPSEPAFVRELLQAGRRANSDYDVERGLAKHMAQVAATASLPTWPAAAAKSSFPAWLGYLALPLAAASVAGVLWMFSAEPTPPASVPTSAPAGLPAQAVAAQDQLASNTAQELEDAPGLARQRRSSRAASRPAAHPAPRAQRSTGNSRAALEPAAAAHAADAPISADGTEPANQQDIVLPSGNPYLSDSSATAPAHSASRPESAAAPPAAQPSAAEEAQEEPTEAAAQRAAKSAAAPQPVIDESRLEREMQMLAVTQRVLGSDPQRALRLAQQGEREFPGTMFSAERRQLGLLALVKLGRLDEARRAGRPFLARYPKAPWSERLRRALATGQVE
jgi:hypothetical protein